MSLDWVERYALTTLYATLHYVSSPCSLRATALFRRGRLSIWDHWPDDLSPEDKQRISYLLLRRPSRFKSKGAFYDLTYRLTQGDFGVGFVSEAPAERSALIEQESKLSLEKDASKPLSDLFYESFDKLKSLRPRRALDSVKGQPSNGASGEEVVLDGPNGTYKIPGEELPSNVEASAKATTASANTPSVDQSALLSLAEEAPEDYKTSQLETFLSALELPSGEGISFPKEIPEGDLRLLQAPTGSGKSVFSEVASLHWASQGIPTAIVVPTNEDLIQTTYSIDRHAEAAGIDVGVAPLFSYRNLLENVTDLSPEAFEENYEWLEDKFGYDCKLKAFEDSPEPPPPGNEPCFSLTYRETGDQVACPFAQGCRKPDLFRRALRAGVIVINHAAFSSGKVQLPIDFGDGAEQVTMRELILRRCGAVLIDEIDAYQSRAISSNAGDLRLTNAKASPTNFQQAYAEISGLIDSGKIDPLPSYQDIRSNLIYIDNLAPQLRSLINGGEVSWPQYKQVRTPSENDVALTRELFGENENASDLQGRLRAFFRKDSPLYISSSGNPDWYEERHKPLADALYPLLTTGRGGSLRDRFQEIQKALEDWPWPSSPKPTREERAELAGDLLIRTVLSTMQRALSMLEATLPSLVGDSSAAERLVDKLRGFSSPSPSPQGPLGRRVWGFKFPRGPDGLGQLAVTTFKGDPHRNVREIGSTISLGVSGYQRSVLGLSATSRFPESPSFDVEGEILLAHPDDTEEIDLRYEPAIGEEADDSPVAISGIQGNDRIRRAHQMGRSLSSRLQSRLRALASTEGGKRILLCTGSYEETRAVVAGLNHSDMDADLAAALPRDQYKRSAVPRISPQEIGSIASRGIDVVAAPLLTVARGINVLVPGTSKSALGTIYILVRPIPPLGTAKQTLAHVSYQMAKWSPSPDLIPARLQSERNRAEALRRRYQASVGPFSQMDPDLRREIAADTLVLIEQLAGRARRDGGEADVRLVDAAFEDGALRWSTVIDDLLRQWQQEGHEDFLRRFHGAFFCALRSYVNFTS